MRSGYAIMRIFRDRTLREILNFALYVPAASWGDYSGTRVVISEKWKTM
jgi:hypothetical protein